jgi:hypothetical protein
VPIKVAQGDLQKCIMWPKKSRKGRQELEKACVISNVPQGNWTLQWTQGNFFFLEFFFVHIFFSILTLHNLTFFSLLFKHLLCIL